mmetsp:Transcript_22368/g.46496  ORF Transcript_22368/g.46496 Transcript_22368/m.46496 type:complete len:216 (+) Transcript_22368:8794-9441(+)
MLICNPPAVRILPCTNLLPRYVIVTHSHHLSASVGGGPDLNFITRLVVDPAELCLPALVVVCDRPRGVRVVVATVTLVALHNSPEQGARREAGTHRDCGVNRGCIVSWRYGCLADNCADLRHIWVDGSRENGTVSLGTAIRVGESDSEFPGIFVEAITCEGYWLASTSASVLGVDVKDTHGVREEVVILSEALVSLHRDYVCSGSILWDLNCDLG